MADLYKFASMSNCYNVGTIKNSNEDSNQYFYLGGLIGRSQLWESEDYRVINCYNAGKLIGTGSSEVVSAYIGNISGYHKSGIVKNCYYIKNEIEEIGKCEDEEKIENLIELEDAEMKAETMISRLNTDEEVYYYDSRNINNGYPILDFQYNKLLSIYSEVYEIKKVNYKNYFVNIELDTIISEALEKIETNGKIKVYKGETEITDNNEKLITGMKIEIALEEDKEEFIIAVKGDVNGDGKADLNDILAINKHRLNKVALEGAYLLAGEVTEDETVDLNDILKLNRYRLGKIENL